MCGLLYLSLCLKNIVVCMICCVCALFLFCVCSRIGFFGLFCWLLYIYVLFVRFCLKFMFCCVVLFLFCLGICVFGVMYYFCYCLECVLSGVFNVLCFLMYVNCCCCSSVSIRRLFLCLFLLSISVVVCCWL